MTSLKRNSSKTPKIAQSAVRSQRDFIYLEDIFFLKGRLPKGKEVIRHDYRKEIFEGEEYRTLEGCFIKFSEYWADFCSCLREVGSHSINFFDEVFDDCNFIKYIAFRCVSIKNRNGFSVDSAALPVLDVIYSDAENFLNSEGFDGESCNSFNAIDEFFSKTNVALTEGLSGASDIKGRMVDDIAYCFWIGRKALIISLEASDYRIADIEHNLGLRSVFLYFLFNVMYYRINKFYYDGYFLKLVRDEKLKEVVSFIEKSFPELKEDKHFCEALIGDVTRELRAKYAFSACSEVKQKTLIPPFPEEAPLLWKNRTSGREVSPRDFLEEHYRLWVNQSIPPEDRLPRAVLKKLDLQLYNAYSVRIKRRTEEDLGLPLMRKDVGKELLDLNIETPEKLRTYADETGMSRTEYQRLRSGLQRRM
jgi:hypothetical protein